MSSADAVPPIFFDSITIDAASRANLANLPPPLREWITPTKCVVMDCDGPKHVLIHDLDGSLTGLGADASILARAEWMHETRADSAEWTWYNIPSKMLYDPAPLNDLGDKGWDMSKYSNYSSGVQSYTYADGGGGRRRRLRRVSSERRRMRAAVGAAGGVGWEPDFSLDEIRSHRQLASAVNSDWRNRMVFYDGDERAFYP